MGTALQVFIGSVVVFTAFSFIVEKERKREERLFLKNFRNWCDNSIDSVYVIIRDGWEHFVNYIVKLGWYYSIHSFLRTLMELLVAVYDYLEHHFERNRARTKLLRADKQAKNTDSVLAAVAEHKEQVSLSPDEGEELREKQLEDLH